MVPEGGWEGQEGRAGVEQTGVSPVCSRGQTCIRI